MFGHCAGNFILLRRRDIAIEEEQYNSVGRR